MRAPVIIGGGLAGVTVALSLAPLPVVLLSAGKFGTECSSAWAQGGVAAAVGADDDALLHAEDTVKAGAGLCDAAIVEAVTRDAPAVIKQLLHHGVPFDRDAFGALQLGLEAAHGRHRIAHVKGDGAGAAIMKAMVSAVRATPSIQVLEDTAAVELLTDEDGICGVVAERDGVRSVMETRRVVLATGGAGALWRHTTNPLGSWGRGLALAARAGAVLGDLEFMQFHPTAIELGRDPMPLASEALRGEGAVLIDETGLRFMAGQGRAELEPRDVVARAIWWHLADGHRVFLDARSALGDRFAAHFPLIDAVCKSAGIDASREAIPVRPAAHYHMGGVVTDLSGRTSVPGLWACGEVACTGLHGANRLASNSLLEAASFGRRVAENIVDAGDQAVLPPLRGELEGGACRNPDIGIAEGPLPNPSREGRGFGAVPAATVRAIMSEYVGVMRDGAELAKAVEMLRPLAGQSDMALVGLMIAVAALRREESRGAQARTDYPAAESNFARRQFLTLTDVMGADVMGDASVSGLSNRFSFDAQADVIPHMTRGRASGFPLSRE